MLQESQNWVVSLFDIIATSARPIGISCSRALLRPECRSGRDGARLQYLDRGHAAILGVVARHQQNRDPMQAWRFENLHAVGFVTHPHAVVLPQEIRPGKLFGRQVCAVGQIMW